MKSPQGQKKENPEKGETVRFNKRAITFFVCLAISILFWLMMSLSKEYSVTVTYPVEFMNLPVGSIVTNSLPGKMDIQIKAKGFYLVENKFRKMPIILIDCNDIKPSATQNYYYLETGSQINKIEEQFSSNVQVEKISPDSVFFNFNKRLSKRVPVKANISLDLNSQYQLSDSIKIVPAFITISAAEEVLAKIDHVETKPFLLKNVTKSQKVELMVAHPSGLNDVWLNVTMVEAEVNVKKYTEGSVELDVEPINLPSGYTLKSFPDKVVVKFNVAFDSYEKINPSMFRAIVDYKKMETGSNKLRVQLEKYPSEIRSIKVTPEKVEFIIRK